MVVRKKRKLTDAERAELSEFLKEEVSKGRSFRAMVDRAGDKFGKIDFLTLLKVILEILGTLALH